MRLPGRILGFSLHILLTLVSVCRSLVFLATGCRQDTRGCFNSQYVLFSFSKFMGVRSDAEDQDM